MYTSHKCEAGIPKGSITQHLKCATGPTPGTKASRNKSHHGLLFPPGQEIHSR